MSPLHDLIVSRIRQRGPITVAEFMELALYHPEYGYYSTAPRRSGRGGDFFTSVDVGALFGELVALQLAEFWEIFRERGATAFHLVEAGAGDGTLARDVLDVVASEFPAFYSALHVTLVDRGQLPASAQRSHLGAHEERVSVGRCELPQSIDGAIVANELLDALPVHRVVCRNGSLREVHVAESAGSLHEIELEPSTGRIARFLDRLEIEPPDGVVTEVGLAAAEWIAQAAAALERGFLLLFDYAMEGRALYSAVHSDGTLASYQRHRFEPDDWLQAPGSRDITAHVNLTSIVQAAVDAGLTPVGVVDQTYFLGGLGIVGRLDDACSVESVRRRLAARTLMMPGGLGSTMKAIAFSRNVGAPVLRGFSSGRLT